MFWIFVLIISPAVLMIIGYSPMSLLLWLPISLLIRMFLDPEKPENWKFKNIMRSLNEPLPPPPPSKANWRLVEDARTQWEMERKYGKRIV
jgi:hypothetical protein